MVSTLPSVEIFSSITVLTEKEVKAKNTVMTKAADTRYKE